MCATSKAFPFKVDCKTVGFFLKISKEIGNAWRKSLMREPRESHTLSVFSLVPHLLFDSSRVFEYAKIRTVLQSTFKATSELICEKTFSLEEGEKLRPFHPNPSPGTKCTKANVRK